MNRMVRITVLLALMTLALSVPCHACWWNYEDDWNNWADDYIYGYEYDYGYDYDYDYDYGYDYSYDYDYDYSYDNPYSSCDFEDYDIIYDYENYEDSYDDINIDDDTYDFPTVEADLYGELDNVDIEGDYFKSKDWQDFISDFDSWTEDKWYTEDTSDPPSNETEPTDPPGTNEGDGGGGNDGGSQVEESSTPTTNDTQSSIYHIPQANEKLFKDNLPAQTLKQECKMDCVPTILATIISMSESDSGLSMYSDEGIRDQIEYMYLSTKDQNYSICTNGILTEDYSSLMNYLFFL